MFLIFPFFILLPYLLNIILAIVIYKDAEKRGLNGLLWALIVFVLPLLIGVIFYLIIRSSSSADLVCGNCHNNINGSYANCPHCGSRLRKQCDRCGTNLEDNWKMCPNCGTEVKYNNSTYTTPVKTKENDTVVKILIGIIVGSILLFIVFFFIVAQFTYTKSYSVTNVIENSIKEIQREVEYY